MSQRTFQPRLDILPPAQRALLPRLRALPERYVLYGGTAIALHLGHRLSIDFDFFCFEPDEPALTLLGHPLLTSAKLVASDTRSLTVRLEGVLLSWFSVPSLRQLETPWLDGGSGLQVAGLLDLAGMKASVLPRRAEAKDYIDLAALIRAGLSLEAALAAGQRIYGPRFNPVMTLKALCYYDDGDLQAVPEADRALLMEAAQQIDLGNLSAGSN